MKLFKKIALGLLVAFVVIQFFRPARNISGQVLPTDITHVVAMTDEVKTILKRACYDCHSNNTTYPWYMNVQPAAWLMANHVEDGKRELNFSEFGSYTKRKQEGKLKAIAGQVKDGAMPISSYTMMHASARLSEQQKQVMIVWAKQSADSLSAHD